MLHSLRPALTLLVVALIGTVAAAASSASCEGKWTIVPAVDAATQYGDFNSLNAAAALLPTDVWAVGQYHVFATGDYDQTLAEHWDGNSWTLVPAPPPMKKINVLNGVVALASNDVWAVGYEQDTTLGAPYLTLIEHWDGTSWNIVQDGSFDGYLTAIAATSDTDIWAIGVTNFPGQGVLEHWDGQSWTYSNYGEAELRAVAAIAPNDVWVVGQSYLGNGSEPSLAIHFDGTNWTQFTTPDPLHKHPGDENWLTSLAVVSSSDIWATGIARDTDYGNLDHTFATHWDGTSWQLVTTPNPGGGSNYNDLWASVALSGNDVWAVGGSGQIAFQPIAAHWAGSAWLGKALGTVNGTLLAITRAPGQPTMVATGNQIVQNTYTGTLVEEACPASH